MNSPEFTEVPRITAGAVLARQLASQHETIHEAQEINVLDHQQEAMEALTSYLKKGGKSGYVEMATATGKTYLISLMAQAAADLGMRTLILAPTVRIAHQLNGEDGQRGLGRFTDLHTTGRTGKRYGTSLSPRGLEQPVVITTYQSLNNLYGSGKIENVDLILADEAHRSLGELTSQTIAEFSPNAIKIGFTATPAYSPEKSLDQLMPDRIFALDIRESVERGITPSIRSLIYETGEEIPLLDSSHTDFTDRELARLIELRSRNDAIIDITRKFVESGMSGVIACVPGSDLMHARILTDQLNKLTIQRSGEAARALRAASIGVHQSNELNQSLIEAYDEGEIDVLSFVSMLEQGWDSERPRFLINASPTTSIVRESQQLGRLLRGKDEVVFVDFVDSSKKAQVTSLHVLGEERINTERRIGGARVGHSQDRVNLEGILGSELYSRISVNDGRLLSELSFSQVDSYEEMLVKKWNRMLAAEGMPEELPLIFEIKPTIIRAVKRAKEELGETPSISQITDYIYDNNLFKDKSSYSTAHSRVRAVEASLVNAEDYTFATSTDLVPEIVARHETQAIVNQVVDALPEQKRTAVRLRFGMTPEGEQLTQSEIAPLLGVTPGRVGQVIKQALQELSPLEFSINSKLSHAISKTVPVDVEPWMRNVPVAFSEAVENAEQLHSNLRAVYEVGIDNFKAFSQYYWRSEKDIFEGILDAKHEYERVTKRIQKSPSPEIEDVISSIRLAGFLEGANNFDPNGLRARAYADSDDE